MQHNEDQKSNDEEIVSDEERKRRADALKEARSKLNEAELEAIGLRPDDTMDSA
jgi:hypothetical protein